MPNHSVPNVTTSRRSDLPGRLILLLRAVSHWLGRRSTRLELDRLSERQLGDIGIERTLRGYRAAPGSAADRYRHLL